MKGIQGRRFLKKLKFKPTMINTLKTGLVFQQFNTQHTFPSRNCKTNNINLRESSLLDGKDPKDEEPDVIDPGEHPSLTDFEVKCPPGGENSVILYTTSMRAIRKTFQDCSSVRFVLGSFKILVHERDVSMNKGYMEELWKILGGRVIPRKLFVKGRYIGGASEVIGLHEQGKLKKLFEEIPSSGIPKNICNCCANLRFLICSNCNGSRKVYEEKEADREFCIEKCTGCNENGLVKCSFC